jgi:phosphoglycerate dehydrogenase-like enzyme
VNADAVAEHTITLMLALMRRIPANDSAVRQGEWPQTLLVQARGRTLGVVGFGAIGSRVGALGRGLGMNVLAFTFRRDDKRAVAGGARPEGLSELLRNADIVSLHLRLTEETRGLLGRDQLGLMKPTAFLVNTARGALVDEYALLAALRAGQIAGAALDVFHREPLSPDDPLLSLPNVVVSPHNAWLVREGIEQGLCRAIENVERYAFNDRRGGVPSEP